ncbi:MAG TPA: dihydroxyacetone kinase subunit DhaL [Actinomycetes bacterium]|jgi:dihydroxyacetone kinase-like protein|nr:dihydroxyacetone kinase subunit DhaL [Actinomycetes bacterium]
MFSAEQAVEWVRRTAAVVEENAAMLTRLDAAIGDGDHGTNMARGFRAVLQRVDALDGKDFAGLFRAVGMALIGKVGGAAGPLYGSFYMGMGRQLGAAGQADDGELAAALRAGYDGVVARGKAQPGDKTMLDAWYPALDALDQAVGDGAQLGAALDRAAAAAEKGMKATIPLVARKGRASYLGERSKDHQDPGATSSHLIVKALADVVSGR